MLTDKTRAVVLEALNHFRHYAGHHEYIGNNTHQYMPDVAKRAAIDAAIAEANAEAGCVPQPDWSKAPEWSNWWAVDPNGYACWFEEEPVLSLTVTYSGWVARTIQGVRIGNALWAGEIDLALGVDWRLLKAKRREAQPGNPPGAVAASVPLSPQTINMARLALEHQRADILLYFSDDIREERLAPVLAALEEFDAYVEQAKHIGASVPREVIVAIDMLCKVNEYHGAARVLRAWLQHAPSEEGDDETSQ